MSGAFADIRAEWRENWRAGLASFVGTGLGGAIAPALFSLFILPLEEAFGWSRSQITLAFTFTMIGGLSAPFVGRLIDRLGPRKPLLAAFAQDRRDAEGFGDFLVRTGVVAIPEHAARPAIPLDLVAA